MMPGTNMTVTTSFFHYRLFRLNPNHPETDIGITM